MSGQSAREKATRFAEEQVFVIRRDRQSAILSITAAQLNESLRSASVQSEVDRYFAARDRLSGVGAVDGRDIAERLRPAAQGFASAAQSLADRLEILGAVAGSDDEWLEAINTSRDSLLDDAIACLHSSQAAEPAPAFEKSRLLVPQPTISAESPIHANFGVDDECVYDDAGAMSPPRLIASFRLRMHELEIACGRMTGAVGRTQPNIFQAVAPCLELATAKSPFDVIALARAIHQGLLSAHSNDPDRTAEAMATYSSENEKLWSAFQRYKSRVSDAANASNARDEAIATLEAYRHLAEGIVRRWIRCMLASLGLDTESMTLHQLAEPALAHLGLVGDRFANALTPGARNAEAHDDFYFDETAACLVIEDQPVRASEIESAIGKLEILQRAWKLGQTCAVSDRPELSQPPRDSRHSATYRMHVSLERFAHAGLFVRTHFRDGSALIVEIDDLEPTKCMPCFVALVQAAQVLPEVGIFKVLVGEDRRNAIELPRAVLEANWPVFLVAAQLFPQMLPQSTFVPCLAWNRLDQQPAAEALSTAFWLVLNEFLHALNDVESSQIDESAFGSRLDIANVALVTTTSLIPSPGLSHQVPRAKAIATALKAEITSRSSTSVVKDVLRDRIERLREEAGPPPALLPALSTEALTRPDTPRNFSKEN